MEVEVTVLNKISQTQREKYIICGLFVCVGGVWKQNGEFLKVRVGPAGMGNKTREYERGKHD